MIQSKQDGTVWDTLPSDEVIAPKCSAITGTEIAMSSLPFMAGIGSGILARSKYKKSIGMSILIGIGASTATGIGVNLLSPSLTENLTNKYKCKLGGNNV